MKAKAVPKKPIAKGSTPKTQNQNNDAAPLPPPTPIERKRANAKEQATTEECSDQPKQEHEDIKLNSKTSKKRKRSVKIEEDEEDVSLPHNIGGVPDAPEELEEEDVETEEPAPKKQAMKKTLFKKEKAETPAQSTAKAVKDVKDAERAVTQFATVKTKLAEEAAKREKAIESGKKTKSESYGLSEGETPYPRWQHPTPEECQEVHDILLKHHPDVHPQPHTIPPPSEFVAGCGEVRSILDALIRTRLSASTTGRNSNAAYQGMVKRYGTLKSGVGKGSVDYNAVRLAPVQDLFYAIKAGGLAVSKSADIKALLDLVYEENQARRNGLLAAETHKNLSTAPNGIKAENEAQKAAEVKLAEEENLSLDHFYTLPTYDAIYKFMTYPGIGVKTAACVAMFCMQRPCFAVDTHVFRLSKWLGWVPPPEDKVKGEKNVDRDTTFSHLEIRIPDHLKYMLHQLFLKHGKTCPRCRGNTGESSVDWADGCVIDHLVQRTGPRKGGINNPVKAKKTKSPAKRKKGMDSSEEEEEDEEDEEDEEAEMPELHDEDEEEKYQESPARSPAKASISTKTNTAKAPKAIPIKKAKGKPTRVGEASSPNPTTSAVTKTKHKSTPTNGWKGGKAVGSREASTDT